MILHAKRKCAVWLAGLVPFLCMGLSATKESVRDWADQVFCGKVVSVVTASVIKAKGSVSFEDELLMKATIEWLHHHKGPALTDRNVFAYYETGTGVCCPPEVRLEVGQTYLFAAITNGVKLGMQFRVGEVFLPAGDFVDATNSCSGVARRYKVGLENSEALAAFIWSGESRLRKGRMKPSELVPLLRDSKIIFTDDDGTSVTVRDAAYSMLDAAAILKSSVTGHRCKVICGCDVNGEWCRIRVWQLNDDDFATVIKEVQQQPLGSTKSGATVER